MLSHSSFECGCIQLAIDVFRAKVLTSNDGKKVFTASKKYESYRILNAIKRIKDNVSSINVGEYEINGRLGVRRKSSEISLIGVYDNTAPELASLTADAVRAKAPLVQVDIALPKRATSIGGRIAYTIAGAASLIPFAAAADIMFLVGNAVEKQAAGTRELYSGIIGVAVGVIVSGKLLHTLSNYLSKARSEFFQQVADAFETAVIAVGKKSP